MVGLSPTTSSNIPPMEQTGLPTTTEQQPIPRPPSPDSYVQRHTNSVLRKPPSKAQANGPTTLRPRLPLGLVHPPTLFSQAKLQRLFHCHGQHQQTTVDNPSPTTSLNTQPTEPVGQHLTMEQQQTPPPPSMNSLAVPATKYEFRPAMKRATQ